MDDYNVIIDKEKCIGCGLCVGDCVGMCLSLNNSKAEINPDRCILCGHCEAVCPKNAIKLTGFDDVPEEFDEQTRLSPEELMAAIKTRRSIRQFTDEKIPQEVLDKIIEAGRLAPTGSNSQSTGYIVLDKVLPEAEKLSVNMFRGAINMGKPFAKVLRGIVIDDNFFFKKAPLAIAITGSQVNASLAAENMAFMAEAYGLGVLYSGFFTVCANTNPKIRKLLKMEKKEKVVTTLVLGYPSVKYHRTVRRKNAKIRKL